MNDAEKMMAIFQGRDPGGVLWQPRLEFWYAVNHKRGALPAPLQNASLEEVYDYCHASIRYFCNPLRRRFRNIEITQTWLDEKSLQFRWETPLGVLTEVSHHDEWNISRYNSEYLVKTPADLKIYEYILQNEEWYWDEQDLVENQQRVGTRGVPQIFARRSPIQAMFIEAAGFEPSIYMMHDYPQAIDHYVEVASAADDAMYAVICKSSLPIFNFGENIDAHLDPPAIWRNHLQPYYQKRVRQLHAANIKTSIHVDGAMKRILKDLPNCPTDAIEACTPLPQGDITLEEIAIALDGRILLDGIPAVFFLPTFPLSELMDATRAVIDLFYPRLVLGISDEIPPDGDIERVRAVGEYVQNLSM